MPQPRTPREQLERAMHVSFKLPEQAREMLDAYRDQVLAEAAELALATPSGHTLCHKDTAAHILAARTGQEGASAQDWIAAHRTRQEATAPAADEPGYVCGVCEDLDCGHCLECGCEACDEARTYAETLASAEVLVLGAARTRVAALPTANDGQLIAASREQILDAITRTDDQEH